MRRDEFLRECWAINGTYVDPAISMMRQRIKGCDQLSDHIAKLLYKTPDRQLRRAGKVNIEGKQLMFRWEIIGPSQRETTGGMAYGEINENNLIRALLIDPVTGKYEYPKALDIMVRSLDWIRSNQLQAGGILLLAFYAILQLPLLIFYSRFEVSPEEVGFEPSRIFSSSLSLLIAAPIAYIVFYSILLTLFWPFGTAWTIRWISPSAMPRRRKIILLLPMVALYLLIPILSANDVWALCAGMIITLSIGCLLAVLMLVHLPRQVRLAAKRQYLRGVRRSFVLLIPATLIATTAIYCGMAYLHTLAMRDGGTISEWFVPWKSKPVAVIFRRNSKPFELATANYLGKSKGIVVLYQNGTVYRLPESDVALRFR
ncbi:hypothetical protein [Nonomuraea maheshkhaliensis]|uniref:hypothetical protein n=1 Tax=Nonomuraea maheshkhaliensis TaxID=419590 RepID=UPI0031F8DB97